MQQRASFAWLKVAAQLRRGCVERLAGLGVTLQELAVLSCLAEAGPLYHNDLAARSGIDKAKLVPLTVALSNARLIDFDQQMPDRRRTQLDLEWSGSELLREVELEMDRFEREFFSALSEQERQILGKAAARLLTPHC